MVQKNYAVEKTEQFSILGFCHESVWRTTSSVTLGLSKRRYYVLNSRHSLTRLSCERVMWLHGWLPVTKATTLPNLVVIGPVEEDVTSFLIWHVIAGDHVIWDSCDFIMNFVPPYVSTLPSLATIRLLEEEIFRFEFVAWPHMSTWSEGHATSLVRSSYHKSPTCQDFWS